MGSSRICPRPLQRASRGQITTRTCGRRSAGERQSKSESKVKSNSVRPPLDVRRLKGRGESFHRRRQSWAGDPRNRLDSRGNLHQGGANRFMGARVLQMWPLFLFECREPALREAHQSRERFRAEHLVATISSVESTRDCSQVANRPSCQSRCHNHGSR